MPKRMKRGGGMRRAYSLAGRAKNAERIFLDDQTETKGRAARRLHAQASVAFEGVDHKLSDHHAAKARAIWKFLHR
jgi:hypothetical protein